MRAQFDRRVVPDSAIEFVRACQRRVDCHLGGSAALAGAYLGHRVSNELDLFVHDRAAHRVLVSVLSDVAAEVAGRTELRLDAGTHVRAELILPDRTMELNVAFEAAAAIEALPTQVEGLMIASLADCLGQAHLPLSHLSARSHRRLPWNVGVRPGRFRARARKDAGLIRLCLDAERAPDTAADDDRAARAAEIIAYRTACAKVQHLANTRLSLCG